MTATVSDLTRELAVSDAHESLATVVDVTAIVLLLVLLVEQEVVRAYGGASAGSRVRALGVGVVPLALAFAVIVVSRTVGWR